MRKQVGHQETTGRWSDLHCSTTLSATSVSANCLFLKSPLSVSVIATIVFVFFLRQTDLCAPVRDGTAEVLLFSDDGNCVRCWAASRWYPRRSLECFRSFVRENVR